MSKQIVHKANSRGHANHGWLNSFHTFSFANYYQSDRMQFGALRVLNDDTVAAGMGFGMHTHQNMEIISIPLEGDLEHKDSMGNIATIKTGDIQVMSAGSGIAHSEYNKNKNKEVKFLQIWILPSKKNVAPRYDQMTLNQADIKNKLTQIISPSIEADCLWIHQDAWFSIGNFDLNFVTDYLLHKKGNGVYLFVLNGKVEIENQSLSTRDAIGIWETDKIKITSISNETEIILMEVPMEILE